MCCLFGLMDYKHTLTGRQKSRIISVLSRECEVRGTDATGVAYNSNGRLRIYKRPVAAHKLHLRIPEDAYTIMGHVRMTTQGSEKFNPNNHPFLGSAGGERFALAHNGVLYNDELLRRTMDLPSTRIQTDSYIAVQLLQQKKALDLNSLMYMAEQVEGSFAFTVMDDRNRLYFVKGDNPLCMYHYPCAGILIYASTEEILKKALSKLRLSLGRLERITLSCGELLRVGNRGELQRGSFCTDNLFQGWYVPYLSLPRSKKRKQTRNCQYVDNIKSVACYFGLTDEDVDELLDDGFTPEELEEYLYSGQI